jgi:hypothetical protein
MGRTRRGGGGSRPLARDPVSGAPHPCPGPRRTASLSRRPERVRGQQVLSGPLAAEVRASGLVVGSVVVVGRRRGALWFACRSLEIFALLSRCGIFDLVSRVVASEFSFRLVGELPEKADVGVGHDRVPGSGCAGEAVVGVKMHFHPHSESFSAPSVFRFRTSRGRLFGAATRCAGRRDAEEAGGARIGRWPRSMRLVCRRRGRTGGR